MNLDSTDTKLLRSVKAKEIFSNDTLRLNMDLVWSRSILEEKIDELSSAINKEIESKNLKYYQFDINPKFNSGLGSQKLIISKKELNKEEINIFENEKPNSTELENNVLRDSFIITINTKDGI